MKEGRRILLWIEDHDHTVEDIAQLMGYSHDALSIALHQNRISERLASDLYEHFGLRVIPSPPQEVDCPKADREPGSGNVRRSSKLDAVADDVATLISKGRTQSEMGKKDPARDREFNQRMNRYGFRRDRTDS